MGPRSVIRVFSNPWGPILLSMIFNHGIAYLHVCPRARATRPSIRNLISSNAARGVTQRLTEITGISKGSLDYFPIRFKGEDDGVVSRRHPFSLVSKRVERLLDLDDSYFEVCAGRCQPLMGSFRIRNFSLTNR